MKQRKLPVHIYLCEKALKIGKLGVPEGIKIAEVESIAASDPYREDHKLIWDKQLCLYDPVSKRIVRKYEHDDWGRIV